MNKLAKKGWRNAMIHQGTLSLILTMDNFLMSGPHLITDLNELKITDPNIFVVKSSKNSATEYEDLHSEHSFHVTTYFVLRPYIRGILFGLNPLYQISLFVPCENPIKRQLYKEIISKIDIGNQFFQDRIYWNVETLCNDIMDANLACLIYAGHLCGDNEWLQKICIESKPFNATKNVDFTTSANQFDLVEMRSFLEDVHQRYFGLLREGKNVSFADMIRLHVNEKCRPESGDSEMTNTSGFYSATSKHTNNNLIKYFNSDRHFVQSKEVKHKKESILFNLPEKAPLSSRAFNTDALLEEYEDIIHEQLDINNEVNLSVTGKTPFATVICRWNKITQRKSDILKLLLSQSDKGNIHERLKEINNMYYLKKCLSENDLTGSVLSTRSNLSVGSGSSNYLLISNNNNTETKADYVQQFTTWYTKEIKL